MKNRSLVLAALLCAGLVPALAPRPVLAQVQPAQLGYDQLFARSTKHFGQRDYVAVETDARQMLTVARSEQEQSRALVLLGESLYRRKKYEQAREQWNKMLVLGGDYSEMLRGFARLGVAKTYLVQYGYAGAIPFLQKLADADVAEHRPNDRELAIFPLLLATAYYDNQQNDLAEAQLSRFVVSADEFPPAALLVHLIAGQIKLERLDFDGALPEFEQALALLEPADLRLDQSSFDTVEAALQERVATLGVLKGLSVGNRNTDGTVTVKLATGASLILNDGTIGVVNGRVRVTSGIANADKATVTIANGKVSVGRFGGDEKLTHIFVSIFDQGLDKIFQSTAGNN